MGVSEVMTQGDLFKRPYFISICFADFKTNHYEEYHSYDEAEENAHNAIHAWRAVVYVDICERTNNGPRLIRRLY